MLGYDAQGGTDPSIVLKLPVAQGDTWLVKTSPTAGRIYDKVEGSEALTVPAGPFTGAWRVMTTYEDIPTSSTYAWYADGVGQVKSVQNTASDYQGTHTVIQTVMELRRYAVY